MLSSGGDAPVYPVTAVDAFDDESVFSNAVRAHPAAEYVTGACVWWNTPCGGDTNTEEPADNGFAAPDPAQVQVPASPGSFGWSSRPAGPTAVHPHPTCTPRHGTLVRTGRSTSNPNQRDRPRSLT